MTNPKARDPRDQQLKPPFPEQEQEGTAAESEMDPAPDFGEKSYRGLGRLKDKVALITGADSGIGRAVAVAFAREGADVVVGYLSHEQDARETCRVVEEAGRASLAVQADLGSDAGCKQLVAEAVRRFGRIDILVNYAATLGYAVE
ncbi:MAG TPA: SDR family NAD(P)-dependent oxidoreductase, partial [Polyangiaceae bacterium]|nr:SDR family NAD(P)-dependent oxidoreductase [Polyangiaceae bacterium]